MKKESIKGNMFYGNKVSKYGIKNGYVDYSTLAKSFDMVLCNDITKLFYCDIAHEWSEAEQVNGFIDNSEEIEELREKIDELLDAYKIEEDEEASAQIMAHVEELEKQLEELEEEERRSAEIYQYYIISDRGAEILQDWTDEIIYYLPGLDIYVWGVTHYGTSWDYVLTNIKIEDDEE